MMRLIALNLRFYSKRILLIAYLGIFVVLYFTLNKPYFDIYNLLIPNPFYFYFSKLSVFIYTINIVVIFGLATTWLEMVLSFVNSTAKNAIEKRKNKIHKDINLTLFDHLVHQSTEAEDKIYARKIKRKFITDYPRLVFINRLRRIMGITTSDVHNRCIRIFKYLRAESLIRSYLHSPYLRHKLFAIKLIGDFQLVDFQKKIVQLMRNRNQTISSEAAYTYVKLFPKTDFRFLTIINKPICKLDFYNFVQLASNYKNIDYLALINSKQVTISALGIRLVSKHRVTKFKDEITSRLSHSNELIRDEAQHAFLNLIDEDDVHIIFEKFDEFKLNLQIKIIKMLGENTKNSLVKKLYDTIIEQYPFELKIAAMSMIMKNDIVSFMKFRNHPNMEINSAYKQLTDFNL